MSNLEQYIRTVSDFPKQGVSFKDITTLLKDANALQLAGNQLFENAKHLKVDKVIGIESRGFMYALWLATQLKAGFVPVRKPGKLPSEVFKQEYQLEYGTDTLEMHIDAIQKGEKVLVHDDVLATGGTAEAVSKLVEKAGGEIVQFSFLIEIPFLNGRNKLTNYEIKSLIQY
ncbi:MAG: adenine phosphoribosyltransferase [Bacteroidetes bacterium]|nr:MAG: adenine phosphoribosyltransferase [Bacteroidota bacterium]TAG87437.1 MAG: adenine phosphoribosyltransferase [Bacteroidota bacterium]